MATKVLKTNFDLLNAVKYSQMWGQHFRQLQRSLQQGQAGREETMGNQPWSLGLRPVLDHQCQPEVGLPLRHPVRQTTGLQRPTTTQPTMTMRKKTKEGDWEVWQDFSILMTF